MLGLHLAKSWSSTQPNPALSSGEAEYYGVVKAAGVGLGYQALILDLGIELPLRLWTDSSAAIGVTSRQGVGKIRHLDTRTLWVQQAVRTGRIEVRKVKGTENPADLFTEHLPTAEKLEQLVGLFGGRFEKGRAECAPKMRRDRLTQTTLGTTHYVGSTACNVEQDEICDLTCLPHTSHNHEDLYGKFVAPKEAYPETPEETDAIEEHGLTIAKDIQDQSDRCGRKRKY